MKNFQACKELLLSIWIIAVKPGPEFIKPFFMLNSTKREISNAHNY